MDGRWLLGRFSAILSICLAIGAGALAQDVREDSLRDKATAGLTLNVLLDLYYAADYGARDGGNRQPFVVNHARQNAFAVNVAGLDAAYTGARLRGRVTLGVGTYFDDNYAAEPAGLRMLYEASAGIRLHRTRAVWLDLGVLPSPYGYEGALAIDQPTLTRSLSAEQVPYYLTGARLSLPLGPRWELRLWLVNGWQVIAETDGAKALGTQLSFRPKPTVLLNWSTFVGSARTPLRPELGLRVYHDLYAHWRVHNRLELLGLVDVGVQSVAGQRTPWVWGVTNAIARWALGPRLGEGWALSGRVEAFSDPGQVVVTTAAPLRVGGASLGVEYAPMAGLLLRLEHRSLWAVAPVLADPAAPRAQSHGLAVAIQARL